MELILLALAFFALAMLPVGIAIYRDKPFASWAMILAFALGVPVIGWLVGIYLALDD